MDAQFSFSCLPLEMVPIKSIYWKEVKGSNPNLLQPQPVFHRQVT